MKIVQSIVIFTSFLILLVTPIFAQKKLLTPTPTPTTTKVEYVLPYPGILPDNPLYFIKRLRDRILDFLIVDPVRKAEFYLLQADKRIGMGVALIEKGNTTLAESTISEGEKYFAQAVNSLQSVSNSGKEVPGYIVDRLKKSIVKHEEILNGLILKATGSELPGFKASLVLIEKTASEIAKFK